VYVCVYEFTGTHVYMSAVSDSPWQGERCEGENSKRGGRKMVRGVGWRGGDVVEGGRESW